MQGTTIRNEFGIVNSTIQKICNNRNKIISAFEQNGSTIKRFWKPERSDVDKALLKLFKQERGGNAPASSPRLMNTLVLPRH